MSSAMFTGPAKGRDTGRREFRFGLPDEPVSRNEPLPDLPEGGERCPRLFSAEGTDRPGRGPRSGRRIGGQRLHAQHHRRSILVVPDIPDAPGAQGIFGALPHEPPAEDPARQIDAVDPGGNPAAGLHHLRFHGDRKGVLDGDPLVLVGNGSRHAEDAAALGPDRQRHAQRGPLLPEIGSEEAVRIFGRDREFLQDPPQVDPRTRAAGGIYGHPVHLLGPRSSRGDDAVPRRRKIDDRDGFRTRPLRSAAVQETAGRPPEHRFGHQLRPAAEDR